MLYDAYEIQKNLLASASAFSTASMELLQNPANPFAYFGGGPTAALRIGDVQAIRDGKRSVITERAQEFVRIVREARTCKSYSAV